MIKLHHTQVYARDSELEELLGSSSDPFLVPFSFFLHNVKYFRQGEDDDTKPCGTIITMDDDTEVHVHDKYTEFKKLMDEYIRSCK